MFFVFGYLFLFHYFRHTNPNRSNTVVPFYNNPDFTKSFLQIDKSKSWKDSVSQFQEYRYPNVCWSTFVYKKKVLVISSELIPLSKTKTRWRITVLHNYFYSNPQKWILKLYVLYKLLIL